jgi:iron complex transport system substrate-binding protein
MRAIVAILLAILAGCDGAAERPAGGGIVSLDYCADQYVLQLVPPERIAALSRDATAPYAFHRELAAAFPKVADRAEAVLAFAPDIVVRTYGGGPEAAAFYERLGIEVVQIGWASTPADLERVLVETGTALGAAERAAELAAGMRARLDAIEGDDQDTVLYMSQGGVTAGAGTLVGALIEASGHENYIVATGWHDLPLERLVAAPPDRVAAAFFANEYDVLSPWSAARHPVARRLLEARPVTGIDAALTACGAWFSVGMAEALSEAP